MPPNDLRELTLALKRLAAKTSDLKPALSALGAYQERQYQRAFDANKAPDGEAWAPLSPNTLRTKRNPKMLVEGNRRIPSSRFSEVTGTSVTVGYSDPLAAIHDQGFTIPARTIVPKNKRALYFAGARHPFKRAVIPATTVPARRLVGYSEDNVRSWIEIIQDEIAGEFDS